MENKNEIEKILASLDSIQKAEANPFLYEKVMIRLEGKEARVVSIVPIKIWQAAACFAVLIALNIFVWTRTDSVGKTQNENKNPLAQEYFSYINNTIQF